MLLGGGHRAHRVDDASGAGWKMLFEAVELLVELLAGWGDPPEVRLETVGRTICPDDEVRLVGEW